MRLKNLMTIKALYCLIIGIPLMVNPYEFMTFLNLSLDINGVVMARLYGGFLMGNLVLTWLIRNDTGSIALFASVLYLFVYNGINFGVSLWATVTGIMGGLGWLVIAIYLFFTIGFGYFIFGKLKRHKIIDVISLNIF